MKKILLISTFLFTIANVAQEHAELKIDKISSSQLHFDDLKNSTDLFSFRFWNIGQVIDIRILSDSTKFGTITNFATEYPFTDFKELKPCNENDSLNVFIQKINLTSFQVQKAIETMERNNIYVFPVEDSIKGWKPVLDGEWFSIEQKVNGIYSKKDYGNPRSQKKVVEARKFISFFRELNYAVKADESSQTFWRALKLGCYRRSGDFEVICIQQKRLD